MKNDRLSEILAVIDEKYSVDVSTLTKLFYASESTIRRDLSTLEKSGLILRSHGKAISNSRGKAVSVSFSNRKNVNRREKQAIAAAAIKACVKEGMLVMLDASSTAAETVRFLKNYKDVMVLTSGIETLVYLAQTDLQYFSSGGQAFNKSYSFIGETAIDTIKSMNADVCFVSCHGLSENGFATDTSIFENDVRRAILEQSKRKVLLIDSSKINKNCYSNLCCVSYFDDVFCDSPLPEPVIGKVKNFHLVDVSGRAGEKPSLSKEGGTAKP